MPFDEKIQEGLNVARNYAPTLERPDDPNHKMGSTLGSTSRGRILEELLDQAIANQNQAIKDFWKEMKTNKRVTKRPHITIMHSNSFGTVTELDLWNRCTALREMSTAVPLFKGTWGNVLWDGRVMA